MHACCYCCHYYRHYYYYIICIVILKADFLNVAKRANFMFISIIFFCVKLIAIIIFAFLPENVAKMQI